MATSARARTRLRQEITAWLGRVLGRPLRRTHPEQPADAAVVLGAPLRPDGSLSQVCAERVEAGVDLWRRGLAPVLCLTGGRQPGVAPVSEADAMARRARALGVPEEALRIEPQATNTADNARFAANVLLPQGRVRVWIVTQPFHLRRALFWFRRVGFEPLGWHITGSLQYHAPGTGLRWVLREYVSWLKLGILEVPGLRRRP